MNSNSVIYLCLSAEVLLVISPAAQAEMDLTAKIRCIENERGRLVQHQSRLLEVRERLEQQIGDIKHQLYRLDESYRQKWHELDAVDGELKGINGKLH